MADPANFLTIGWLTLSNFVIMAAWARVFYCIVIYAKEFAYGGDPSIVVCQDFFSTAISTALVFSFAELFNAIVGFTKSKPIQVGLFSVVRFGVAKLVAPLLACNAWQWVLTVACWSLGDTIRFGCFGLDSLVRGSEIAVAKNLRYMVAPILFPIGAFGEMLMVLKVASDGRPMVYLAAALWPAGFYPLFQQLLRQRKKHFAAKNCNRNKEIKTE